MKTLLGTPNHFSGPVLGIVTRKAKWLRRKYILVNDINNTKFHWGYAGFVSNEFARKDILSVNKPCVQNVAIDDLKYLKDGDIILIKKNGEISVIWDKDAIDNSLLLTEECNCNCWMCPQPPAKDKSDVLSFNKKILSLLDSSKVRNLCLTGGEPTLLGDGFVEILKTIKQKFPNIDLPILTNGKRFSDFEFTKAVAQVGLKKIIFCVSIHGDTSELHDRIVRKKGSFNDTVRGLHYLAKFRQNVELRYVVNKFNHKRLKSFANFVYRNFPFVVHIAFMAQEISGYAESNFRRIWIDPGEYQNSLYRSAQELHRRGLNVSIYNVPLCLLPRQAWPFARKSISGWKNDYLPLCSDCAVKTDCCGVFTTSHVQSEMIKPI